MEIDKKGQIEHPEVPEEEPIEEELIRISDLGNIFQHVTTAPTHTPRNFREQFILFDDGTDHRLYIYIDGAWKKFYSEDEVDLTLYIKKDGTIAFTGTGAGFKDEDDMSSDSATAVASQQSIKKYVDDNAGKFGGDGSDGALDTSSSSVNIDCANAALVIKDYTSINVATNNLTFTNPHTNGTIVIPKSQGNVTISATINISSMGAAGTNLAIGVADYIQAGTTCSAKAGAVAAGAKPYLREIAGKVIKVMPGSGGGKGGVGGSEGGSQEATRGAGGIGGGGLIIECGGALDFSGTINASGGNGGNATTPANDNGGSGGGGGGGGATVAVIYKTLTANTGTMTINGGNGGNGSAAPGGSGSKDGGGGASGSSHQKLGGDGGDGGQGDGGGFAGASGSAGTGGYSGTTGGTAGTGGAGNGGARGGGGGGGGGAGGEYYVKENTEF